MARSTTFDYISHNQKIAKLRGKEWRNNLKIKKLEACANKSALKIKRVGEGLSQAEMLPRVAISTQTTYARIERGERTANKERAFKIAKALRTSVKDLFIEVDPNKFLAI